MAPRLNEALRAASAALPGAWRRRVSDGRGLRPGSATLGEAGFDPVDYFEVQARRRPDAGLAPGPADSAKARIFAAGARWAGPA